MQDGQIFRESLCRGLVTTEFTIESCIELECFENWPDEGMLYIANNSRVTGTEHSAVC